MPPPCPLHPKMAGHMEYPKGGMGIHFVNLTIQGPLDPMRPNVLIYEPVGDKLELVAAEWLVPVTVAKERPVLFGQPFQGPMEGHEPAHSARLHPLRFARLAVQGQPARDVQPDQPGRDLPGIRLQPAGAPDKDRGAVAAGQQNRQAVDRPAASTAKQRPKEKGAGGRLELRFAVTTGLERMSPPRGIERSGISPSS